MFEGPLFKILVYKKNENIKPLSLVFFVCRIYVCMIAKQRKKLSLNAFSIKSDHMKQKKKFV